ncbi:MAG: TolC family protein [Nitrospirae bacterium]|nr:TolC family protein [Nitrospirota bacterium]
MIKIKKLYIAFFVMVFISGTAWAEMLSLSDGLRLATENNRLIKISFRERDMSHEDTLIARSRMLPNVNATISQTFLSNQPGARLGAQNLYTSERNYLSYGINAYQTLFSFGADTSRYEASKSIFDAKKLGIDLTKNIVALNFITAYFDLLETEKMFAVSKREVERLESHRLVAKNLFNEGVITKNDLLQAEVRLSDAKQRMLTLKNLRAIGASRINNILSRPLNTAVEVEDAPLNAISGDRLPALEKAWTNAENQRVEFGIIDREIKAAELEETVKRSDYFPKLFAQGGYNYAENRYQLQEDNWSIVMGVNFNLFSGGSTKAEVSKVRHRKEQLNEQRKKLADDIRLDVEKNYLDIKNAEEKIRVTKDAVAQAEENLRINKVRYEEGIGTATDVLDAITLLTTAETNYYRAAYELRRAEAGFGYAIGTDLVSAYK